MSDISALTEKLTALAAGDEVFVEGARVISSQGGPSAVADILREIDNTVLERTLVLGIGDATVSLIVAGRRLKGVLSASGSSDPCIGKSLSQEEPKVVKAVGSLLLTLCSSAPRVTVRAEPVQPFGKGGEVGVSVKRMTAAWDPNAVAEPKQPPIPELIAANAGVFSTFLHLVNGTEVAAFGDTEALHLIWNEQVMALRKRQNAMVKPQPSGQLMCFDGAMGQGTAVGVATAGDEVCICTFASDKIASVTSSWQALIT